MDQFQLDELGAALDRSTPATVHVRLSGRSATRDAAATLAPLFERILTVARDEQRVVVLHFERLDYFNSSTIAALVHFIRTAQDARVGVTVVYDPKRRWQVTSFDALRSALGRAERLGAPAVHFTTV